MKKTALAMTAAWAVSAFAVPVHAEDPFTETMRAIARKAARECGSACRSPSRPRG